MGNQQVCCCSRSNGDNDGTTAEPPAPATEAAEPAADAKAPKPAPASEEAGRDRAAKAKHYVNSVCEKILALGKRVPVAGKFCELVEDAWQAVENLKDTVDDAKDVIEWAAAQEIFFRAIVDTTCTDIESLALRPFSNLRDGARGSRCLYTLCPRLPRKKPPGLLPTR